MAENGQRHDDGPINKSKRPKKTDDREEEGRSSSSPSLSSSSARKTVVQNPVAGISEQIAALSPPLVGNGDVATVEETVKTCVIAVAELSCLESSPLKLMSVPTSVNGQQMWDMVIANYHFAVRSCLNFVKQLSDFADLPLADRRPLFSNALVPLMVAQVALPSNSDTISFFGYSKYNEVIFLKHFELFQPLNTIIRQVVELMAQWNPSFLEFALLTASLFFKHDCYPRVSRPDLVCEAHRKMAMALISIHPQGLGISQKMDFFINARKLLFSVGAMHRGLISDFAIAFPDLFYQDKLFAEMFGPFTGSTSSSSQQPSAEPSYYHRKK